MRIFARIVRSNKGKSNPDDTKSLSTKASRQGSRRLARLASVREIHAPSQEEAYQEVAYEEVAYQEVAYQDDHDRGPEDTSQDVVKEEGVPAHLAYACQQGAEDSKPGINRAYRIVLPPWFLNNRSARARRSGVSRMKRPQR